MCELYFIALVCNRSCKAKAAIIYPQCNVVFDNITRHMMGLSPMDAASKLVLSSSVMPEPLGGNVCLCLQSNTQTTPELVGFSMAEVTSYIGQPASARAAIQRVSHKLYTSRDPVTLPCGVVVVFCLWILACKHALLA